MRERSVNAGFPISLLFLLVFAAILGSWQSGILQITFSDHARTSHPEQASKIDNCFEGGGVSSPIFKTSSGRFSQYCDDGSKNNYWRIYECVGDERVVVTQFKQAIRQLTKYIRNHHMMEEEMPC